MLLKLTFYVTSPFPPLAVAPAGDLLPMDCKPLFLMGDRSELLVRLTFSISGLPYCLELEYCTQRKMPWVATRQVGPYPPFGWIP